MKKYLTILSMLILSTGYMNAQCTANYSSSVDPANNGQVTFTNTSSVAPGGSYYWDFGDGNHDSTANPPTHTYSGTGTYYVCLTVMDSIGMIDSVLGCYNTYCSSISVIYTTTTCNAHFNTYLDSIGGALYFNSSSYGTITNYLWDFGDGTTSTLANPGAHSFPSGGIYNVCLTTTNPSTLCNSTYCDTVFISSCAGSFTYTPDATGNGVTFNGSSTGTGSAYAWDFGDGLTSTLQNPHHVFGANGTFHVCMTVSSPTDSTCSSTTCQNVTVSGLCSANFYVTMDSLAFDSTYFIYSYASGSGTISYLWDFGDGSTSTLAYPTHTYATSGPFYICLTVSDGIGCSDTHCDSIGTGHALSHPITLYVLNATGIQEQTNIISSLENYPNPFNDNTTISYSIKKDAMVELSILDLLGNKIATIEKGNRATGGYSINWNSEGVAEGLYLLQLKVDNNISTKKLVISK